MRASGARWARASASTRENGYELRVVDGRSGKVVIDSTRPQRIGAALGDPRDTRFASLARAPGSAGVTELAGHRTAYRHIGSAAGQRQRLDRRGERQERRPAASSRASGRCRSPCSRVALVFIALAGGSLRASRRELEAQATTDGLTGLGNRRKLLTDLERRTRDGHRRSSCRC